MPTGTRIESRLGRPAVPVGISPARRRCKQEADLGYAVGPSDAQCPVLIVASELGCPGPPLADHVHQLAVSDTIDSDPGLQRDRVPLGEIEFAVGPRIGQREMSPLAIELRCRVVLGKVRKLGRSRPSLISLNATVRGKCSEFFCAEIPASDYEIVCPQVAA